MTHHKTQSSPNEQIKEFEAEIALLQSRLAIERESVQERETELVLLNTVTEALNNQKDIQAIYELVGDRA